MAAPTRPDDDDTDDDLIPTYAAPFTYRDRSKEYLLISTRRLWIVLSSLMISSIFFVVLIYMLSRGKC